MIIEQVCQLRKERLDHTFGECYVYSVTYGSSYYFMLL